MDQGTVSAEEWHQVPSVQIRMAYTPQHTSSLLMSCCVVQGKTEGGERCVLCRERSQDDLEEPPDLVEPEDWTAEQKQAAEDEHRRKRWVVATFRPSAPSARGSGDRSVSEAS